MQVQSSRLGRSPGGGRGNPIQYSYLESPMDRGAWWVKLLSSRALQNKIDMSESKRFCSVGSLLYFSFLGVIFPRWRKFPGGGNDNPLQYSCLENPMDKGA